MNTKHDNLIVTTARTRRVYQAGIDGARRSFVNSRGIDACDVIADILGGGDAALDKWLRRNVTSEVYTFDDDDAFLAGYEYGALGYSEFLRDTVDREIVESVRAVWSRIDLDNV